MAVARPLEPAIADHAIIGDCRSAALVTRDATIDWLCWPRFDSPSLFGAILDAERGGAWRLAPPGAYEATREYVRDTVVVRTRFRTATGSASVYDCFPVRDEREKHGQLFAQHELLRVVAGEEGDVALECDVHLAPGYARSPARFRRATHSWRVELERAALYLRTEAELEGTPLGARGAVRVRAGERVHFSLSYSNEAPAVLPPLGAAADARLERTVDWWRGWVARCTYGGEHRDALVRSLLTLKLLVHSPSGAVIAAPTTSLPERLGGDLNWDYRYCWLRDAALTLRAFLSLGYHEEADAFVSWLLHATRLTRPRVRPFYDVYGEDPARERTLERLRGHRGSAPVRDGNAAAQQSQLDVYGELIDAVALQVRGRSRLDRGAQAFLRDLGRFVCEHWQDPDAGIWEDRYTPRTHTVSLALAWVALDRLLELHGRGLIGRLPRERFERERDLIARELRAHAWDEELGSYVAFPGRGKEVDASLLLLNWYRFEEPGSPRARGTFDRVRERLGAGPWLLYRRERDVGREGAFLACSFWAAELLARRGEPDRCREMLDALARTANDVGLYSEEVDPATGAALGNFPQGLTHLAHINALVSLERARAA